MKKTKLIILGILISGVLSAQDTVKLESTIKSVIVYREGAQIKRTVDKDIEKGRTTVVLTGMTSGLDINTIKVSANKGITVVSVLHRFNFMNKDQSNRKIDVLSEDLEGLTDSTDLYRKFLIVLNDEKSLLQTNKSIGGSQNGVNIENLKATAEFYRSRMKEIELEILFCNNKIKAFNKDIIKISRQLNELNVKKEFTTSDIVVVLASKTKQKAELEFEYFIKQAGWKPYYDIRVTDVNEPVKMVYKAKIFQNTDIDWKEVKLTLSTGNPSVSGIKPILNPYVASQNNYYRGTATGYNETYAGYIRGKISDDSGESLPGVSVLVKGTTTGTMTDANGNYTIHAPLGSELVYSYIGMQTVEQAVKSSEMNMRLSSSNESIDEVVVTALGVSREKKSIGYAVQTISGDELMGHVSAVNNSYGSNSRMNNKDSYSGAIDFESNYKNVIPLNMKSNTTNREFVIDITYTIRSDNKEYDVMMTEFDLKGDYEYRSVPKLSESVYLTALITDWQDYGMLNGAANVFFKETFTGKTYLDLEIMKDTLSLSLGIDNDVIVKREQMKEFSQSKNLGSIIKESRAWKISVKNMKQYPINLIIEDQMPITQNNKIKVDNLETSEAKEDPETGQLEWRLNMKPSETKELILKYAVKYPANLNVVID